MTESDQRTGLARWTRGPLSWCGGLFAGAAAGAFAVAVASWCGWFDRTPQYSETLFPDTLLHASAASRTTSFAAATGPIDDDVEGLFVMDHLTGELTCYVMSWRAGKFTSIFKANVIQDLGIEPGQEKAPEYLLVTGEVGFRRGGAMARPAQSIAYVLDGHTGMFAAYGMPWNRGAPATGRPQAGNLILLDKGLARTAALRE